MESTGKPGEIQVSSDMMEHVRPWFELEDRGMVSVKGKGEMNTWMLKVGLAAPGDWLLDPRACTQPCEEPSQRPPSADHFVCHFDTG